MTIRFICLHREVEEPNAEDLAFWKNTLQGVAIWGGAEEADCHYSEEGRVFSVRVKCEDSEMLLIEAGMALGAVASEISKHEERNHIFGAQWLSLHDEDGSLIESTR